MKLRKPPLMQLALLEEMIRYRTGKSNIIEELDNHKGTLVVIWLAPTSQRMKIVNEAWKFLCEWHVEHWFNNVLIAETKP